jgi:hypothetical protein
MAGNPSGGSVSYRTGQPIDWRAWRAAARAAGDGEVATAVLLLVGAGLLVRTLLAVESFDRGYRAESVLSLYVDPIGSKYPTPEALQQFYDDIEREVRSTTGVRDMAWTSSIPLGAMFDGYTFEVVGDPPVDPAQRPTASYQTASATYFSALDLPIVEGRAFTTADARGGQPVAIINEAFARRYFPKGSPVGRQIAVRTSDAPQAPPSIRTIVGIARQVKRSPHEHADLIQFYGPTMQDLSDDIYLVVRPQSGDAALLTPGVRAAIGRIDKEQLVNVQDVMTLADLEASVMGWHRFRAVMVTAFAGLALVLAMVGVFGALSYTVQVQMRDFGVRRALRRLNTRRADACDTSGPAGGRGRRGDRSGGGRDPRPIYRDSAVRRAAAGSRDVHRRWRRAGRDRRAGADGAGLACGASGSGQRAQKQLTRVNTPVVPARNGCSFTLAT